MGSVLGLRGGMQPGTAPAVPDEGCGYWCCLLDLASAQTTDEQCDDSCFPQTRLSDGCLDL